MPQRRSDVFEMIAERFLVFSLGGLASLGLGVLFFKYKGDGNLLGLAYVLAVGGVVSICLAFYSLWDVRQVKSFDVACPYCEKVNTLTAPPNDDFCCQFCNRLIPIMGGKPLEVFKIECEHCRAVNFYSKKTEVLLCEECNYRIDVSPSAQGRAVPKNFIPREEDLSPYELILVDPGGRTEEVMDVLQQMLALNRGQVRQIMLDAPVKLLTGITRRKAEVLQAQLAAHDASAEFRPIPQQPTAEV